MKINVATLVLFCLTILLSSCAAIAGIFKAGVWVGVLVVVGIIALILFLVTRGKS
ncbi:MAG: phosphatidate cytidylyltransferase [Bacteroidota bacterium]